MYYLKLLLLLICGISWTFTYSNCIVVSFKEKIVTMPFIALALNITWEAFFTIKGYQIVGFHPSTIINIVWFLFDILLLTSYLRYSNQKKTVHFYSTTFLILVIASLFQYYLSVFIGAKQAALFSAFWSNLLMSVLFIHLFIKRKGNKGQRLSIAILKCIGTFTATILVGIIGLKSLGGSSLHYTIVGGIIFIIDVYYIYLLKYKSLIFNHPS